MYVLLSSFSLCVLSQSDGGTSPGGKEIVRRCKKAITFDMTSEINRDYVAKLIEDIKKDDRNLLRSPLYKDIPIYYEQILKSLGQYCFDKKDYKKALKFYLEADKYSIPGYSEKIDEIQLEVNPKDVNYIWGYTRSLANYRGVERDFPTLDRLKGFVSDFITLCRKLRRDKEFDKLRKCKDFWGNYFIDHVIFTRDEDLRNKKKEISAFLEDINYPGKSKEDNKTKNLKEQKPGTIEKEEKEKDQISLLWRAA